MELRRLCWAGVSITIGETIVLIDPLLDLTAARQAGLGSPRLPVMTVGDVKSARFALVTHIHPDHYDPVALRSTLAEGGMLLCPPQIVARIEADGLPARGVKPYETVEDGTVSVTAAPAVDGLGEWQLSWIVKGEGKRVIHCGDTLWHGFWWRIARLHGPFDVALLPINGPLLQFRQLPSSGIPASMTPEQAAAAAAILGARMLCPIHYGMFNNPPVYTEQPDALESLHAAAAARGVSVRVIDPGETLTL